VRFEFPPFAQPLDPSSDDEKPNDDDAIDDE
jgi:hypothetical protein